MATQKKVTVKKMPASINVLPEGYITILELEFPKFSQIFDLTFFDSWGHLRRRPASPTP